MSRARFATPAPAPPPAASQAADSRGFEVPLPRGLDGIDVHLGRLMVIVHAVEQRRTRQQRGLRTSVYRLETSTLYALAYRIIIAHQTIDDAAATLGVLKPRGRIDATAMQRQRPGHVIRKAHAEAERHGRVSHRAIQTWIDGVRDAYDVLIAQQYAASAQRLPAVLPAQHEQDAVITDLVLTLAKTAKDALTAPDWSGRNADEQHTVLRAASLAVEAHSARSEALLRSAQTEKVRQAIQTVRAKIVQSDHAASDDAKAKTPLTTTEALDAMERMLLGEPAPAAKQGSAA